MSAAAIHSRGTPHAVEFTLDSSSQDIGYVYIEGKKYKVTIEGAETLTSKEAIESTLIKAHMIGMTILQGKEPAKVIDICENEATIYCQDRSTVKESMSQQVLDTATLAKEATIETQDNSKQKIDAPAIENVKRSISSTSLTCKQVFQSIFPLVSAPGKKKITKTAPKEELDSSLLKALESFDKGLNTGDDATMGQAAVEFESAKVNPSLKDYQGKYAIASRSISQAFKALKTAKKSQPTNEVLSSATIAHLKNATAAIDESIKTLESIDVRNTELGRRKDRHIQLLRELKEMIEELQSAVIIEKDDEIRPATGLGFTATIKMKKRP